MDRRDAMAIPGSASFYMQRGMAGSGPGASTGLNVQSGVNPLSNTNVAFQSSIGASTMPVPIEPSAAISPPGVNVGAPSTAVASTGDTVKRKRGRPRKYGPDGTVSLVLSSPSSSTHPGTITPTQKRGRGRPPGTGRKQQLASLGGWLSGSAGIGFTPHVILISVGEDIASKIMSFSQQGPRAICILSANGSVSTVTLCQPSTSGGSVTYEGCFEILCLSGSYLLTDNGGSRNRTGGLSISLASPDGRVIGGGVGGMLIAASPVQVILGSFIWGGPKTKNKRAGPEGARGSDHQTAENPVTTSSHSLAATSSAGVWPDSQPVDMRNTHVDIDLMRGL